MMDINDFEIHFQNIIATLAVKIIIGNPQVFKKVGRRIIRDPPNQKKRDSICAVIMVKESGA